METKNCQNCKKDFNIEPDDFSFYEKMKVPAPTFCPECRMIRRLSFSNVLNLYRRNCSKCSKSMISMYSPDKEMSVYCMPCWWADDWDGIEYGIDYDPSRPFFDQLKELSDRTPYATLEQAYLTLVNSDYVNFAGHLKNCYLTFWADFCENVFYSTFLNGLKDSIDCYRMKDSELCYDSVGCNKCYRTFFSEECDSCNDVWFSRSCSGCANCFGCINLKNKTYCIFNEQYSRDTYFEKLKEFKLDSRKDIDKIRPEIYSFWNKYPRRAYIGNSLNVNVSGDYIYESKNAHNAYMVGGVEDSKFIQFVSVPFARDCYDYSGWGNGGEQLYECNVVGEGANNIKFCHEVWPNVINVEYSIYAISCKNIFGCINLKHKEYCILNKQYPKEEYEELVKHIKEDMINNPYIDNTGIIWKYGEFLPSNFSHFSYNETLAGQLFMKTKEEVLSGGLNWYEKKDTDYSINKKSENLPDIINETDESVLDFVIECIECKKAFKIVREELHLMKKLSLPIPHNCLKCRQDKRFKRTNPPIIFNRTCDKCGIDIKTSYAPDRPEIVYCEKCYQQEIM